MGDTALNVPVKVRTHELQQVQDMMPAAAERLEQAELDDAAEQVNRIFEEHVEDIEPTYPEGPEFAAYLSMPAEDWRMTIRYLNRARGEAGRLRVHWLQNKLVTRIEDRLDAVSSEDSKRGASDAEGADSDELDNDDGDN